MSTTVLQQSGAAGERLAPDRGKAGILAVILTESAFFSIFVFAYLFYIGKSLSGPLPHDVLDPPIFNSICLFASSATIVAAVRALRAGRLAAFRGWWLATLALAIEFLAGTGAEWHELIYHRGLTVRTNLFGTTYYSLVGLHAAHVVVGVLAMSVFAGAALRGVVKQHQWQRAEVLSWYWHFVDAVWVVVFLTVYVIGR